ncbi:hypothetical protein GW17_00048962 [Ensete ventricosum]|nr:hypothetical protein GW17_00048962 [Ensete ventricosum]RZS14969.1 hypothetical protein BHM03_00046735 [Ensete ventricosum]
MSGSSIHPRLGEAIRGDRASRALSITPFIISSKSSHYPTNTKVQMDILSNKIGIYRKHMHNNKIYMCLYEIIRCK